MDSKKTKKGSPQSTILETASLLGQLAEQVSALAAQNELTPQLAGEYLEHLGMLEGEIKDDDETSRNLRDMVKVVKAQLLGAGMGKSDKEVEAEYGIGTYSSPKFWDEHYKGQEKTLYDWYVGWKTKLRDGRELREWLQDSIDVTSEVLMLGCGNSPMSLDMYEAGYKKLHNIDVSETVISQMKERHGAKMPQASWDVMDAEKLVFGDGSFDVVVDKGTLDAVSTDSTKIKNVIGEMRRTVRAGGTFVSIGSKSLDELQNPTGFQCQVDEITESGSKAPSYLHRCKRSAS